MGLYSEITARYAADATRSVLDCDSGSSWTCSALEDIGDRMLTRLYSHGLQPGDRVLAQVYKSAEFIALYLACLRARLLLVPLNTAYTAAELDYFIGDADPALVVLDPRTAVPKGAHMPVYTLGTAGDGSLLAGAEEGTKPAQSAKADDGDRPAVIIYTSGTTGRSKGAVLSRDNLLSNAKALNQAWRFTSDDTLLHSLPVFHVHGLFIALHTAMLSGARIRFCASFDPEQVCRELPGSTVFMGVPTYYSRLLARPELTSGTCRTMRLFVSGSAPLMPETCVRFEQVTGHRILERYGMSETNVISSNPLDGERVPGTVGFALGDTRIRIADAQDQPVTPGDVGAVQVHGPGVFSGYWRRPDLTDEFTADGYFRTGDLGQLDPEGRLTLSGRAKDLIISGGLNVYPAEIEQFLNAVPGVAESAVVGVPDHDFGERVEAFLVADDAAERWDDRLIDEVRDRVTAGLANFKRPKAFHLIAALPRNTMGKVQKNQLRERLLAPDQPG